MKSVLSLLAVFFLCSTASAQLNTSALERAMANPGRPAADKERDASRKAPQVLAFVGLEPGMTVIDLIAIGGWYSEVLALAVGDNGKVYMQNNPSPFVERNMDAINDKLGRLSNLEHLLGPVSDVAAGSVDFVMTALNFHDVHNENAAAAQGLFTQVLTVLKPGGILAVIDHEGTLGADNASLHRVPYEETVKAIVGVGFALVGSSEMLDNPADDHTLSPSDASLGRNTDRFVLKFVKM
ncbi:MAG: hypothetical protein QGG67_17165 [Gammaproteobacteria bacterium]|nr:hypothetical protein [Gammaproteobacteria bacterium]